MGYAEKNEIRFNDGTNFMHTQTQNIPKMFIMLKFHTPGGTFDADFHWQTWVDGGANVYAKYWNGSSWATLGQNNGGSAPPEIVNDVSNKFGFSYLLVLLYGNVQSLSEDWIKCDIGKVIYSTATSIRE